MNFSRMILAAAFTALAATEAQASVLQCFQKGRDKFWINSLSIDVVKHDVRIDVGPYRIRREILNGTLRYFDKVGKINGYPAYAFDVNLSENRLHIFKLFYVFDKWHLVDATLNISENHPTLVALGESVIFDCK